MEKYNILTISDMPLAPSGVAVQTRYMIEGLLKTGKYKFRSLGGALSHQNNTPLKVEEYGEDWFVFPVNGYGDMNVIRQFLDMEKFDAVWFMTDPRFFGWLFASSDEVRNRGVPLIYNHIWDNYPVPVFNKPFYDSCDHVACISKLTYDILCKLGLQHKSSYIPHAVDPGTFKPMEKEQILKLRKEKLGLGEDSFVMFYNSRNARRKMTTDIVKWYSQFLATLTPEQQDKCMFLLHTDPHDQEGSNLLAVCDMLKLTPKNIKFSTVKMPPEEIATLYNIADVTVNASSNEGFGLSVLESLMCGTPVIGNKTGGIQDQMVGEDGTVWGQLVTPATTSMVGSQEIPYIFDDKNSDEQMIKAYGDVFKMTFDQRKELGKKASEFANRNFSMVKMISDWDSVFENTIANSRSGNIKKFSVTKI